MKYNKRYEGEKKDYCDREECLRQAKNEAQRKWYKNKRNKDLSKTSSVEKKEEPRVVYSTNDKIEHNLKTTDTSDIKILARELGSITYQLVELIKKEREKLSIYDKQDQEFLHRIENLEELTDQEAINLMIKEKKIRESRRNNKVRIYLIQSLLNGITIKNPAMFVEKGISNCKNWTYTPKIKEGETENE